MFKALTEWTNSPSKRVAILLPLQTIEKIRDWPAAGAKNCTRVPDYFPLQRAGAPSVRVFHAPKPALNISEFFRCL
jgi:hypothetical protein